MLKCFLLMGYMVKITWRPHCYKTIKDSSILPGKDWELTRGLCQVGIKEKSAVYKGLGPHAPFLKGEITCILVKQKKYYYYDCHYLNSQPSSKEVTSEQVRPVQLWPLKGK